ncbi:MAG: YggT family protein [Chloroflexi bacterium]|jgi:YggT family protein|nr:MAG: YggT family protein [Chloroflexota bacterium]
MNGVEIAAIILQVFFFIVLARVLMSWLPMITNKPLDYSNPIVKFLTDITEPVLAPMRRFLIIGMIDLSPMVLLIGLSIIQGILLDNA